MTMYYFIEGTNREGVHANLHVSSNLTELDKFRKQVAIIRERSSSPIKEVQGKILSTVIKVDETIV